MLKSVSTLWPYLWRYRKGLALGLSSLLLKDALAASLPVVIKYGVDTLTRGFQFRVVMQLAGLLIAQHDYPRASLLLDRLTPQYSQQARLRAMLYGWWTLRGDTSRVDTVLKERAAAGATELCSVDDGLPVELDGHLLSAARYRQEQLKAYGNAIVPQVAIRIMKAIKHTGFMYSETTGVHS